MPKLIRPETEAIYQTGQRFIDSCLLDDGSLFTPGQEIWSVEPIAALYDRLVANPDESKRGFEEKLRDQLTGAPAAVFQFAGELLFVHFLVAGDIGGDAKRRLIEEVLSWSPDPVAIPEDLSIVLDHGIASTGVSFKTRRPNQLAYLLEFLRAWKALSQADQRRALDDPWVFKELAFSVPVQSAQTQREALLHLVHPSLFEPIVSQYHKAAIADAFADRVTEATDDVDRQLEQIRASLEVEYGKDFEYYHSDVAELWQDQPESPVPEPLEEKRYWLFQASPKVWDLEADLTTRSVGDDGDWSVTRFEREMQPGDGVILWSAGERAGIYALGEITSQVVERPYEGWTQAGPSESGTEPAIAYRYTSILEEPILKSVLVDHPLLRNLAVIRGPQGSNFRVTKQQWAAVQRLARPASSVWWVNQGATYNAQRDGEFLWAPAKTLKGASLEHWSNVTRLQPGDVVLHYANGSIRAISQVADEPGRGKKPPGMPEDWQDDGNLCQVALTELTEPVGIAEIPAELRVPDNGPFTSTDGSVTQVYLWPLADHFAEEVRQLFTDQWPPDSPWGTGPSWKDTMHLLFKWTSDREPRTVELHKGIADRKGSVWWGKFGTRDRAALSPKNVNQYRSQLADAVDTYVFLYRPGEAWQAQLEEITADPDEVDAERFPDYYGKDECNLFVRISGLERRDPSWPAEHLVLANNPDPAKMPGALGNQRTPLMVKLVDAPVLVSPPEHEVPTMEWLVAETLWDRERLEEILEAMTITRQVVLAGPPGTGKTWVAERLAKFIAKGNPLAVRTVVFHPSYGYEEFIEGLRPTIGDDGELVFDVQPGIVKTMVEQIDSSAQEHVLVIDEMNRANLSRVFGELMYLFEYREQPTDLQYTSDFTLPENLVFIGSMNTADRSIRSIDIALRRRFDVFECPPDVQILERFYQRPDKANEVADLLDGFEQLNSELANRLDRHHTIGQSFFMADRFTRRRLEQVWDRQIGPLIDEYFFDQPDQAEDFSVERFWPGA